MPLQKEMQRLSLVRGQLGDLLDEECNIVPISHQVLPGVYTVIVVPKWVEESLRVVIAIDLTAIGGPLFADIQWQLAYRSEFEALAAAYGSTQAHVFTQGYDTEWVSGAPYKVQSAQVVHVSWSPYVPSWIIPPTVSFWDLWKRCDPPSWECLPWHSWLIVRSECSWLLPHPEGDIDSLYQAIADRIGCPTSYLCFQRDPSGFAQGDFTVHGRKVIGIVAVANRDPDSHCIPLETSFTFVDARRVGRGVRAFLCGAGFDAASILRYVDPQVPAGCTAALHTRLKSPEGHPGNSWDWQELSFKRIVDNDSALTFAGTEPADTTVAINSTEGPAAPTCSPGGLESVSSGFYAASSSGPPDPIHSPLIRAEAERESDSTIWFLLFAPDRAQETVGIPSQAPLTWNDAIASVVAGRDPVKNKLYGHIVKVHPQPSAEFATLICLPEWASSRLCVVVDCRAFDGRLFCFPVDPWLQWGSFLLQVGLPNTDDFVVIVNGVAHVRGRPLELRQGNLVQVIEYGTQFPPFHDIGDLLFTGGTWVDEQPIAHSSSFSHFWVLHDNGSLGIDAAYHAINSAYGFQEFVADKLLYAHHRTTLQTARPQIDNAVRGGVACRAVVIVTECLPSIPVPPGRVTTPSLSCIPRHEACPQRSRLEDFHQRRV